MVNGNSRQVDTWSWRNFLAWLTSFSRVLYSGMSRNLNMKMTDQLLSSEGLFAIFSHRYYYVVFHTWRTYNWHLVDCRNLPAWYKSALFNELYYVSDGGTVWVEVPPNDPVVNSCQEEEDPYKEADLHSLPNALTEYGRFAYLEGNKLY